MFRAIVSPGVAVSMVCAGLAQVGSGEPVTIVATGVGESVQILPSVLSKDREPVLAKAWQALARMVKRRPDGTATSLHRHAGRDTWVEWKGLTIEAVGRSDTDPYDWQSGVTRRYRCLLTADWHRVWQDERISWSEWQPEGYPPLPRIIEVVLVHGEWEARSVYAGDFIPPGGGDASPNGGIAQADHANAGNAVSTTRWTGPSR